MAVFYNQATLTYAGGSTVSNITQGEIAEELSVTKTAVTESYTAGEDTTYAVSLVNTGEAAYTGLTVTDDLGAYELGADRVVPLDYTEGSVRYFVNGELQAAPDTEVTEAGLVITGINVPANGNAMLIYEATPNGYASPEEGGTVTNTVTVSGGQLAADLTASATITAVSEPVLSIVKSLTPLVVSGEREITYTFTVYNNGSAEAGADDELTITDTFDPVLTGITVTLNGAPTTAFTYDETTGAFVTTAGAITVPAASFSRSIADGEWVTTPGQAVMTVTGTI